MTPSLAKLGQMAGHRAPGRPCGRGKRADRGEAPAGAISEADEVLQRPVQMPADGAVDVKCNRDKGKHGASGVQRTRLEAADFGRTLPVHAKGACEISRFRGSSWSPNLFSFLKTGLCRPALRGGFCYFGFWCRGLAEMEPCAQRIPRAA